MALVQDHVREDSVVAPALQSAITQHEMCFQDIFRQVYGNDPERKGPSWNCGGMRERERESERV